jgi:hypothetical protein
MLNRWLQEAKDGENEAFLAELLRLYQMLPVTVDDLKKDNTARSIKGLTKHSSEGMCHLNFMTCVTPIVAVCRSWILDLDRMVSCGQIRLISTVTVIFSLV